MLWKDKRRTVSYTPLVLGTPALAGHIGKSVAGSGTDAYGIGKANAMIHKAVEHLSLIHI